MTHPKEGEKLKPKEEWEWTVWPCEDRGRRTGLYIRFKKDFPPFRIGHFDLSMPLYWPDRKSLDEEKQAWQLLLMAQKHTPRCHRFELEAKEVVTAPRKKRGRPK